MTVCENISKILVVISEKNREKESYIFTYLFLAAARWLSIVSGKLKVPLRRYSGIM